MLRKKGLDEQHAYCVQKVFEIQEEDKVIRLLKIKNPVGKTEWNGDYSKTSLFWTAEPKEKVGFEDLSSGEFFI